MLYWKLLFLEMIAEVGKEPSPAKRIGPSDESKLAIRVHKSIYNLEKSNFKTDSPVQNLEKTIGAIEKRSRWPVLGY